MHLDINLATRRYEDARQFWILWGTALGALGILTLFLLATTVSGWYDARLDHMREYDAGDEANGGDSGDDPVPIHFQNWRNHLFLSFFPSLSGNP